jgi:RNA polymerase sigma-B factor
VDHKTERTDPGQTGVPAPGPHESLADEGELLRRYHATGDPVVREELVARFLPLARSLAMRYSGGGEPSDDLVQVASLGLIGAIDRFDPQRGVPFGAFAGPTILGELRRHFRDRVWTLRVPRGLQERIREVEEAITKLANDYERSPTIGQIAERLEITEDEVLEALEASDARRTMSLDQPTAGDDPGDTSVGDRVGRDDPGFELVEERSALRAGTRALSDLEREVLRLRFVEDLTQSKIAARVGYSQMHVSRILRRALERMRATAQADEPLPNPEQDGLP